MDILMRVGRRLLACVVALGAAAACNQLIGVDEPTRVEPPSEGNEAGVADAGGDGSVFGEQSVPVPGLGPGPYALAYSGTGVETATLAYVGATTGAGGTMTQWALSDQSPSVGTNMVVDVGGSNSPVIWGRWAGGTTAGRYGQTEPFTRTFPANGGLHYALGRGFVAGTTPTSGTVPYSLVGGTRPTTGDGASSPGTVSGSASVAFAGAGSTKIGVSITIVMPGDGTYVVESPGATAAPTMSKIYLNTGSAVLLDGPDSIPMTGGRACSAGNCVATVAGFFAGSSFERLALAIQIFSGGAAGGPASVTAVAVFAK